MFRKGVPSSWCAPVTLYTCAVLDRRSHISGRTTIASQAVVIHWTKRGLSAVSRMSSCSIASMRCAEMTSCANEREAAFRILFFDSSSAGAHQTTVHQQWATLDGEPASPTAMPEQAEKQQPAPSHLVPHESVEPALKEVRIQPPEAQMPQLRGLRMHCSCWVPRLFFRGECHMPHHWALATFPAGAGATHSAT